MSEAAFTIVVGAEYVYTSGIPAGCLGHRYRVLAFILDVPSYQQKVLVEALTGRDEGLLFCCSPANFSTRYRPLTPTETPLATPANA